MTVLFNKAKVLPNSV